MKKTINIFLSLLFVFTLLSSMAVFSSAAKVCGAVTNGSNVGNQDYIYNWARNIQSYLEVLNDGRLMRVQGEDNSEIGVEYYNSSFQLTKTLYVKAELPLFGGFYAYNGYYYILSGKSNREESDSAEVYRLTKYDTNWNRLSSCSLYGANTYVPFNAGTARFASVGKYIFVHTCHTMYDRGDGLHHQANVMIQVDTGSMTVTDSYHIVMNSAFGYCSHSFNQFVTVDGGKLVSLNHGDAHPRSVVLMKYNNSDITTGRFSGGNVSNYTMLGIKGKSGENYTGVKVGGFETSSTSYLVAGTTISQKETAEFAGSNVFVSVLNKSTGNVSLKYITAYNDESIKIAAPQLVPLGSDSFVLMWNIGKKLYLCKLDADGNTVGSIRSVNANLSDCKPIIYNGKIVWYTFVNSAVTFYSISTSNLASLSVSKTNNDHVWKKVSTDSEGVSTFRCENCSKTKQAKIPTSMDVWWVVSSSENSTSYTSYVNTRVDPKTSTPRYWVDFSGGDTDVSVPKVKSSDSSVARVNENGYIDFLKCGTATVTFSCVYDSSLKKEFSFTVRHIFDNGVVTKAATCTATGVKTYTCTVCKTTKKETIAKVAHKAQVIPAVAATCTKTGLTAGKKCSVCGTTITAQTTTKALGHDYKSKVTAPTCTAKGYTTYTCSRCKATYKGNETAAKGHSYNSGKISKAATCTATGVKIYTCTVCKATKPETIAKTAHKAQVIPAVAATCTATGLTEGKKCSVCGTILKKQTTVAAAGHTWDNGNVIKEPTYKSKGEKILTCTVCGETKKESMAELVVPIVAKVSGLEAGKVKKDAITLKWSKANNADKYEVYRSTDGKTWTNIATTTKLTYTDKNLKAGAKYQYKVTGLHSASGAKGADSEVLKTGTLTAAAKISSLKSTKSKTVTVKWGKVTGAKKYIVYTSKDGKNFKKATTVTKTTATLSKLAAGKKVYVKVVAVNAYGKKSADSALKSVKVKK